MRHVRLILFRTGCLALGAACAMAQQPIAIGPDSSAGYGPGLVKFFDWYTATPSGGCVAGASGFCVGHTPPGRHLLLDRMDAECEWTAGDQRTAGCRHDQRLQSFGNFCNGNIGVMQLDTFNWASPTASHMTKINCMTSYGTVGASHNEPAGWNGSSYVGRRQDTWARGRIGHHFQRAESSIFPWNGNTLPGTLQSMMQRLSCLPIRESIGVTRILMRTGREVPDATAATGQPTETLLSAMPPPMRCHVQTPPTWIPRTVRSCGRRCLTARRTGIGSITDTRTAALRRLA